MNVVYDRDSSVRKSGSAGLTFIPDRPGQPGIGQRSIFVGAMTITANDTSAHPALLRRFGIVLGTIRNDVFPFGTANVFNWAARGDTFAFPTEKGAQERLGDHGEGRAGR
jgi:hypothetical protein